jgi:hypothetical protein
MGLELYLFWILVISLLVLLLVKKCNWKDKIQKFQDTYLYNAFVVLFLESTLETTIALSLMYRVFNEGEGFQYTIARVLTIILTAC